MLFRKKNLSHHGFLGQNAKTNFFEVKMCLLCSFYHIKVQAIAYWSSRLTKHQTLEFWLLSAFVRTSKNPNFRDFSEIFENRANSVTIIFHDFRVLPVLNVGI